MSHIPYIIKLNNTKHDILKLNKKVIFSDRPNRALISLGFHEFFNRTRLAMNKTNNLETKDKFYRIVLSFETTTPNYKNDLINVAKKYLDMKEEPKILSRAFFKMWEMLFIFDLINKPNLTYAALAEGPGSFIQSFIKFRQHFKIDNSKDKIFGITLYDKKDSHNEISKKFLSHYKKTNPKMIKIHKTYDSMTASQFKGKDTGNITDVKTLSLFKKDIEKHKKYADLVTADGGFDWKNETEQEQESYKLIFGEIIGAIKIQNKNGNFILKLFDTFTTITLKMISTVSSFYDEAYIYKPFTSRQSNSEKYLVLKGFKYDQTKDEKFIKANISVLEDMLKQMINIDDKKTSHVSDIFSDMKLDQEFVNQIIYSNIMLMNRQQIIINKMINYINGGNYFGKEYHSYLDNQIKTIEWWESKFFPKSNKLTKEFDIKTISNYNQKEMELFFKNMD